MLTQLHTLLLARGLGGREVLPSKSSSAGRCSVVRAVTHAVLKSTHTTQEREISNRVPCPERTSVCVTEQGRDWVKWCLVSQVWRL